MQFFEEKDYVEPRAVFKLKLKDQGDELFEAALMDEEIDIIKDFVQGPLEVRGLIKKNRLKWNKVPQGHIYRRGTEIVLRFIAYINNQDQLRSKSCVSQTFSLYSKIGSEKIFFQTNGLN